jgi:hypothetical protein
MAPCDAMVARQQLTVARIARADERTAEATGGRHNDLTGIAAALEERGVPTARGAGPWYHAQVRRLLARMPA